MSAPRIAALVAVCGVVAACGGTAASDDGADVIRTATVETVSGVGRLPDPLPPASILPGTSDDEDEAIEIVVPTTEPGDEPIPLVGEVAMGNRLIVIGDSILASTASRFGGELCNVLEPLGWQVAVEAEPGRFVEFGGRVLDRLLVETLEEVPEDDEWHAAVVHLGSNYDGDEERYRDELGDILFRLAPRPTVLLTITEFRDDRAEVNEIIQEMDELFENVRLVDWNLISETPGVLSSDGIHPVGPGQDVLVQVVTAEFGEVDGEGDCLRSTFTDDSAIGGGSSSGGGTGTFGSGSSSGGSSSGGSSSGGSTGSSGSGTTTTVVDGTDTTGGDSGGESGTGGDSSGGDSGGESGGDTDTGGDSSGGDSGGDSGGETDTGGDSGGDTDTGGDSSGGDSGGDSGGSDTGGGDASGGDSGGDSSGGDSTGGGGDSSGGDSSGSTGGGGDSSGGDSSGSTGGGGDSSGGDSSGSTGGTTDPPPSAPPATDG